MIDTKTETEDEPKSKVKGEVETEVEVGVEGEVKTRDEKGWGSIKVGVRLPFLALRYRDTCQKGHKVGIGALPKMCCDCVLF